MVAALLPTTPRPRARSSADDFTQPFRLWCIRIAAGDPHQVAEPPRGRLRWLDRLPRTANSRARECIGAAQLRPVHRVSLLYSGRDSDLEAFSHNPPDGSLAPSSCQTSTHTKCLNLRFLSYWQDYRSNDLSSVG